MRIRKLLATWIIMMVTIALVHGQSIIYVNSGAWGDNNGSSWENAYLDLSEAIMAARSGDQIWVAAGVYYPTMQPNYPVGAPQQEFNHFTLKKGVSILGGFLGHETNAGQRNSESNLTILSGDIDRNDDVEPEGYVPDVSRIRGRNSLKLFYFPPGMDIDSTAVLDGFILTGAYADNDVFPYMGGAAMLCQGASPKVANCTFMGNYAKHSGGAIWIENSTMILENCTFIGNKAESHGGAVCLVNAAAVLKNSTFSGNEGRFGGALNIQASDKTTTIDNCVFENNKAIGTAANGGGIDILTAVVRIKNSTFTGNTAVARGGGIAIHGTAKVDIIQSEILSNTAGTIGGGIGALSGSSTNRMNLRITNARIQGNDVTNGRGGGISYRQGVDGTMVNVLLAGNRSSQQGSAIDVTAGSKPVVINTTIVDNVANMGGTHIAAIRVQDTGSTIELNNSILVHTGNDFSYTDANAITMRFTRYTDNVTDLINRSEGRITSHPRFINAVGDIALHTGGNYRLWGNSPVNNKGSNTFLPLDIFDIDGDGNATERIPFDLDGRPRVFAGVVDLGCYEQQFETVSGNMVSLHDGHQLRLGDGVPLNNTDFTIEFWIKPGTDFPSDSWFNICGVEGNSVTRNRPPSMWLFQYDRIHYGYGDGTNWVSGDTQKAVRIGQWNHIAMTFNKTTRTMTMYANGELLEQLTGGGDVVATPLKMIANTQTLRASLDEFRVWKEERTQEQLIQNMNRTLSGNEPNLVLYYPFDEVTGEGIVEDMAGNNNGVLIGNPMLLNSDAILTPVLKPVTNVGIDNFTVSWFPVPNAAGYFIDVATDEAFQNMVITREPSTGNTSHTVSGLSRGTIYYYRVSVLTHKNERGSQYGHTATKLNPPGNAFVFDGQTYIDATHVCKYPFVAGTTIETWIKKDPAFVQSKWSPWAINPADGHNNYTMFYEPIGGVYMFMMSQYNYTTNSYVSSNFPGTTIQGDTWHHIAVTIDNVSKTGRFYLDGELKGTFTTLAEPYPYGSFFSIGQEFDVAAGQLVTSDHVRGQMDEFRIWDKPLTQQEIQNRMNITLTGEEDGLVTYYNFDLQTGSVVIDNANVFDGRVVGNPIWAPSTLMNQDFKVFASALTFNGFTLNWEAVQGASTYTIEISTDSQFKNIVSTSSPQSAMEYTAQGLEAGTRYYFRINTNNEKSSIVNYTATLMQTPGNAMVFNGINDWVEANQVANLDFGKTATIESWVWVDPSESRGMFWAINTSTGGNRYLFSYENGRGYNVYRQLGGRHIESNFIAKGTWVHVAATIDADTGTKLYVNGVLEGSIDGAGTLPFINGDQLSFGQEFDGLEVSDFFKGAIDEVRIWNTIRTQEEILAYMHRKVNSEDYPELMAYFDFDQTEGQFVSERVRGLDGTIMNNPQWIESNAVITPLIYSVDDITPFEAAIKWHPIEEATDYRIELALDGNFQNIAQTVASTSGATAYKFTGLVPGTQYYARVSSYSNRWSTWSMGQRIITLLVPPGNALAFDGIDGVVEAGQVMASNWNAMTLESWIKLGPQVSDPNISPRILSNYVAGATAGSGAGIVTNANGNLRFEFRDQNVTYRTLTSNTVVTDNNWRHVAAVFDGNTVKLFIDGVLDRESTVPAGTTIRQSSIPFAFGNQDDGVRFHPLNGTLDEIRIWNVARTAEQISEFAHKPLSGNEAGLVAYYNVDLAEGTTFKDEAGNFDATMKGGVTWAESKALITPFAREATNISGSGFTAHWSEIPNAQKYFLRVATDPLLTQLVQGWENVEVGNVTSFEVSGLTEHTSYYYGVMSETDRPSAWSPASARVKTTGGLSGQLAIDLTGNANYIDFSAHLSRIAGRNAGAITGWFKGTQNGIIFDLAGANAASDNMRITLGNIVGDMNDESFWFYVRRDNNLVLSMGVREGHDKFLDGNWHHFAIITGDGNNRILIDGKEREVHYYNGIGNDFSQEFSRITNPAHLRIGQNRSLQVNEFAIYTNPITNEEVLERAHRPLTGNEMGLALYYNFNETRNDIVVDASGKGRNANIVGTVSYERSHVLQTPFLKEPVTGVTVADLSWTAIKDAEYYIIDIARDDRFRDKILENQITQTPSYHISQLSRHSKYFYRVKAMVNGEWSEWSSTGDFYTIPGNSMVFDRAQRQYIRIDGVANYGSDQATIECWVKPENFSGNFAIWAHNNAVNNTNQYVLVYSPTTRKFGLWTMNTIGGLLAYELPGEFDLVGKWNHIAASIIKDGPSVIYLNGKSIFEFTHHLPPIVSGFHFSIAQEWDNNYAASDFFHGEIDEFRVWNIALTEQQIRENMNISKPLWASEHFIAHYTFDEIHDNVWVRDQAKDNHGRLFGGPTTTVTGASGGGIVNPDDFSGLPVLVNSEGVIVPITLEPTNVTSGSFTLNINNIPSAQSFEVVVAYDPTFVPPLALHKNIGKVTSFNAEGLCPGVEYFFRARAIYDNNTISDWSVTDKVTTVAQNAVIQNFVATQGDYSGRLRLNWSCTNDYLITDFEIGRRIKGTQEFEQIGVVSNDGSVMQYFDETALPGTYYEYSIQGISYCYNNNTALVVSNVGYNIPRLFAVKEINETTNQTYIRLDWEYHPDFCNNIEIKRVDTESGITQTFQEVKDSLAYRDADAALCITYSYQLIAKTSGFGDVNSRTLTFTLEQDIFSAIDTLDASKAYFDNRIILNWVSTSQNVIDEYQISRRRYGVENNWQVVAIIDRGTTQSWIDNDAIAGVLYEYSIRGMAKCGSNILFTDMAYSVGMRQPEGTLSGLVTYKGGNPVADVKITTTLNDNSLIKGHALKFSGNDSLVIIRRNHLAFNGMTVEMYVKPDDLSKYFSLFENNSIMLEYDGNGSLMAQSGSTSISYNLQTNSLNAWEINSWNHVALTAGNEELRLFINGELVSYANGNLLTGLDDRNIAGREYNGQIDELRIWRRALSDEVIKRNHTLVLGRDEDFLVCALRFDEGLGIYAFDHSRTEGEPNKTHAYIYGADWSQQIPSVARLSPGAFTEATGSYQVNGLRFRANGQTYRATPSLGVHAFDPASRTMLISENSLVHGSQNFTDISSFEVAGNVKYFGADFPVEGVMIAIDGQIAVNVEGQPIVTDKFGNFKIEVPIGDHFIAVQKMGHTFSQGFFPPKDADGNVTFFNFNDNLSGIQFIDSTFRTVAGRIVGGTVEGDKPIGLEQSVNNLGVSSFKVKAAKGYPISENIPVGSQHPVPVYEIIVNTDPLTGEYELNLFPEVFEFVGQIGNSQYIFNSIDDLSVLDLSGMMNLSTDTVVTETGDRLFYDYHVKRNWIYRSVPRIVVTAKDGSPHFYDRTLIAEDEDLNPVTIDLLTQNGQHVLGYPVFTKGITYNALINVFEEYVNVDNGAIDQVPVNDGTVTVINTCAAFPAPVDYEIENGVVEYEFFGGFPNPTVNMLNPELSYTKTFEVHAKTGNMNSKWPAGDPFRAYVFGGIPTGNNFVTQGPDLVDFILRDPAGSNSRSYFESGFTISNSVSNSFSNSMAQSMGVEVDLGWEVTTFVGFGAGIISTNEQIANVETGVSFETEWEQGSTFTTTTTVNKSYSTSSDPAYVGKQGDLFFGHSTNISYGVSNYVKVLPVGSGDPDSELGLNVNGYTIGRKKGINFGLKYSTDFVYSLNHIENYLIPNLEEMYEHFMHNNLPDTASYYQQQADIWKSVLAENEYQKYVAINTPHKDDKNISFDAGAVYEESITTEVSETRTSSFSFSIEHSVASEVGLSVMGMGTTWSFENTVGAGNSKQTEDNTTSHTTIGFELADGDQGDYFSVDVMKCHFGNGPIFVTKGGQSACPYEGGVKVEYAEYLDREDVDSGFYNGYDLSFPTMRIEVPKISAQNAIIGGIPDNQPAEFILYLSNQSEINAPSWYTLTLDVASNPYGAIVRMDGASISSGVNILIPGGTTLTKTLQVFKGRSGINDYDNINIILHSMCQFDPTDDLENISDTVTISARFVPVCTNVAITNPNNNWLVNTSGNNQLPVTIGDYNIQHGTFERVAFQYRSQAASNWNTAMMFFKYADDFNAYDGPKAMIGANQVIHYNWDVSALQDRIYLIRAVSMCSDGSVTVSEPLTGVIDRQRPQVFGTPSPGNGILSPGDNIMVTFNEPVEEGLITHYNFVVEGVLNGATLHHGTSVELNGTNNFIVTPDGINLAGLSYSIELWMQKPVDAAGTLLSFGNEGTGTFSWNYTAEEVIISINDRVFSAINPANDNKWHHWSLTWSNESQALILYVNDKVVFEKSAPALTGHGPLYFGKRSFTNDNHIRAMIHDVRVWRKALTFSEIIGQMNKTLAGNEMGLLGYWPMDEGKGNMLTDKARSRHATLSGNWSLQPGGNAVTLNGIDQALIINTSSIPVSREMDLTLELWFNAGAQGGNAYLLSNGGSDPDFSPAGKTMNIYLNEQGNVVVESNGAKLISPRSYTDNKWHHMAFVVNRRGYATLYMNGDQVAQVTSPQIGSFESPAAYIGARGYLNNSAEHLLDGYFNGSIDEVRLWNTARRQKQVEMYAYHRLEGTETGLKAYFPFEKYEQVMGVLMSVSTLEDQSVDPDSSTNSSHCGTLTTVGQTGFTSSTPAILRPKAKSKVNFDFVVNNDRIIINPTEELANIERCILEITVKNIEDKNGNRLASPVTWTAFVEQNLVRWGQHEFALRKELSESLTFTTTIVNLGGTHQSFNLSNLPAWLQATPTNGTLNPNSQITIQFRVADGVNIGRYSEEIYLQSSSGYNEKLLLNIDVFRQAPDWSVNENLYSQSMNVIGKLRIRGVFSNDENDMIAAFVGNECRGVARLEYKPNYDDHFVFLVVYGHESVQELTYKVWDASEGKIFSDVSPSLIFEPNAMHGTIAEPVIFEVSGMQDNTLVFNPGWNWVSFNLEMNNPSVQNIFSNMVLSNNDLISHAEWFSTYSSNANLWMGTLSKVEIGKLYRVFSAKGGELTYLGSEVLSADHPIELVSGWNRIGYVPSVNMTVNEALSGFEPQVNDVIKGQHQFAMWDGYEWIGSLKTLRPGRGYMYRSLAAEAFSFVYPDQQKTQLKSGANNNYPDDAPAETVNLTSRHEHSMSVVGKMTGIQPEKDDQIAAYINGEIRGRARFSELANYGDHVFMTIAGQASDHNKSVEFRLIRGKESIQLFSSVTFEDNAVEGVLRAPVLLMGDQTTGIAQYGDLISGVRLYPNPFTGFVYMSFMAPDDAEITIVNAHGALVSSFTSQTLANDLHMIRWDGENNYGSKVMPGVYYIRIMTASFSKVLSVVKSE